MTNADSPEIYAVDFDGYLCEDAWPDIGAPRIKVIEHFKALRAAGNKLILWTCREGELLKEATAWCNRRGLYFDAINANLPDRIALFKTDPRKIGADYFCDDRNYSAVITEADRIRSMTDEQLASFLNFWTDKDHYDKDFEPIVLQLLQQEIKETEQ